MIKEGSHQPQLYELPESSKLDRIGGIKGAFESETAKKNENKIVEEDLEKKRSSVWLNHFDLTGTV